MKQRKDSRFLITTEKKFTEMAYILKLDEKNIYLSMQDNMVVLPNT